MTEFKVGDVVQLRSGGLPMTIYQLGIRDNGIEVAFCSWMSEDGRGHELSFPLAALKKF